MNSKSLAKQIRLHALHMANKGSASHIGSAFSIADILAVLYGGVLKVNPQQPKWEERDRFVLSKGHAGAALYAALACRGFFPVEKLLTHYQDGSDLCGHVSHKGIRGVEVSTGSLGHGLSIGTGMAYSAKLDTKTWNTYVLLSDGECDEGSNWEAILFASHHKLSNLTAIVDYNKIQSLTSIENTLALEPFADKWRSFGWDVREVDGHDHEALHQVFVQSDRTDPRPKCILAHTTKGKGVSFMENSVLWHYRPPKGEQYSEALKQLEAQD